MLFGLVMVLTFTLGAGLTLDEDDAVRQLLYAALGCNLAWGIIDAVFHVMGRLFERHRDARRMARLRSCEDPQALALIRQGMDPDIAPGVSDQAREALYRDVLALVRQWRPQPRGLSREDLAGGLAVFCLVFGSALPAALPFLLIEDPLSALRLSNGVLLALLGVVGWRWGHHTGTRPWLSSLAMLGLGLTLVGIAIALGG